MSHGVKTKPFSTRFNNLPVHSGVIENCFSRNRRNRKIGDTKSGTGYFFRNYIWCAARTPTVLVVMPCSLKYSTNVSITVFVRKYAVARPKKMICWKPPYKKGRQMASCSRHLSSLCRKNDLQIFLFFNTETRRHRVIFYRE